MLAPPRAPRAAASVIACDRRLLARPGPQLSRRLGHQHLDAVDRLAAARRRRGEERRLGRLVDHVEDDRPRAQQLARHRQRTGQRAGADRRRVQQHVPVERSEGVERVRGRSRSPTPTSSACPRRRASTVTHGPCAHERQDRGARRSTRAEHGHALARDVGAAAERQQDAVAVGARSHEAAVVAHRPPC